MNINVKSCSECPFLIKDIDNNVIGADTCLYCNLLVEKNFIVCYDSYENKELPFKITHEVLPNCPLLKEEITIKFDR